MHELYLAVKFSLSDSTMDVYTTFHWSLMTFKEVSAEQPANQLNFNHLIKYEEICMNHFGLQT